MAASATENNNPMYNLLANAKLLVIDDFAQFRATMKTMLYKLGAVHVDQAGNAVEAMKFCQETDYDIIFCDYNLGDGQDGQQFLEELHQRHMLLKGSLFLMVTAESTSAQVMGAIEYRPDAYLTKPFTNEQLGQRLKRLLQRNTRLKPVHKAINENDTTTALALCDALMEKIPNLRFSCLRLKSEMYEKQKNYEELTSLYQQVIDEQPLLWAELGMGKVHFAQGDTQKALEHFQSMQENYPQQVSILDWIASCQQQLGETDKAEATLKQAIGISPKSVSRQSTLGEVAQSLQHHETAQQAFQKTIEEGYHSCLLQPEHYRQFFDNTREVANGLSGRDQGMILARTETLARKMERRYHDDPTALAANLSSLVTVFSSSDKNSLADDFLAKLGKTLENPACNISEQQFGQIEKDLQNIGESKGSGKHLDKINARMSVLKENIAQEKANDKSARQVNREGMNMARSSQPQQALEKFREAIRLMPQNPNYKLNAAQILLTGNGLADDAESANEARGYLESISLQHTGTRWRLYKKLKGMLPDD